MADPWGELAAATTALAFSLPPTFEPQARIFIEELNRWNRVSRLTGYRTPREQVSHLILESLLLLRILPEPASPLLDIGTGPGVPGLVLKLARPDWSVTLVEASRRRANFLRHVTRRLGLGDVAVCGARAEALAADPALRGGFRTVTMRAVVPFAAAMALGQAFLAADGQLVIPLAPDAAPPAGRVCRVGMPAAAGQLPRERSFLIMRATELPRGVPRGTRGERGLRPGRRESEGRRREDDDRREPGGRARRR